MTMTMPMPGMLVWGRRALAPVRLPSPRRASSKEKKKYRASRRSLTGQRTKGLPERLAMSGLVWLPTYVRANANGKDLNARRRLTAVYCLSGMLCPGPGQAMEVEDGIARPGKKECQWAFRGRKVPDKVRPASQAKPWQSPSITQARITSQAELKRVWWTTKGGLPATSRCYSKDETAWWGLLGAGPDTHHWKEGPVVESAVRYRHLKKKV
ncbi:hypothetical protein B0T26DRAFT_680289 [Lasiosphaeria miniovina]|uniref:Uncharacterized protein n=1 Tax=Lasiosphaeria miniovina TaxID=1954250 RepID=A0AA39ZZS2_9PEZI|nr:uncharacterized protein B0T26DRAFT_680289 [Lasiosphaeria miniovina]KAK0706632.1 hypothetical protein B0T26DRAFT_680289 [Lasiosphaeria miniovina]